MKGEIKLVKTVMFAGIAASKPVIAEQGENFLIIRLHPHALVPEQCHTPAQFTQRKLHLTSPLKICT